MKEPERGDGLREQESSDNRVALTVLFTMAVFAVLFITMSISGLLVLMMARFGMLFPMRASGISMVVYVMLASSLVVGTTLSAVFSRIPLRPMNTLITGLNRLADGKYDTRIRLGRHRISRELSDSFNKLAGELNNTEMLRGDFVNNFSHEFKTPIVSIRGFARLLRKGGLTEAQRNEYLDIIVDESTRLADMATNVLNLTKVENQSILTDVTTYNLSEQLRASILLLEKKWTRKRLNLVADFAEHQITANEELLKQVWINLLDNAIKFSPEDGELGVAVLEGSGALTVRITNHGPAIPPETQQRMFDKFWQEDSSHKSEGNGIGLSLVRRVVALHKGRIAVESDERATTFQVTLPVRAA